MFFSDSITLRKASTTLDSYGDSITTYTDTTAFANEISVKRSEFYAANMAGIKIDTVFVVHVEDYLNQEAITVPAIAAKATVKSTTDSLTIYATTTLADTANALSVRLTTNSTDALSVTKNTPDTDGIINIALAKTTASKNTAALIQAAIRALVTVNSISVTGITCEAGLTWDTTSKATGESGAVVMSGGTAAKNYTVIRSYKSGEGTVELMCAGR